MPTIFVPYDFSENAANTLIYALKLAETTGSHITIFHALAISAKIMSAPVTEEKRKEVILQEEQAKTEELKKEVELVASTAGVVCSPEKLDCKVSFGPIVVETIIYAAEDQGADLIVMGTHGASGLKKFLFGSVTSSTISKSAIPVLAIPEGYRFREVRTIAYASDLENFEAELSRVLPFSKTFDAVIKVLYFNYGFDKHKNVTTILEKHTNEVELVVKKADSSITLLNQIKQFIIADQPQWIAMFTRERSMWDKLFLSSKTEEMATGLQIPLLSFRKDL